MPGEFLSEEQREYLREFTEEVSEENLIDFFTLSENDMKEVNKHRKSFNKFGFALQMCILRYSGFCPKNLNNVSPVIAKYIGNQLGIKINVLKEYGKVRKQTRTDHLMEIQEYLGFRKATELDLYELNKWLTEESVKNDDNYYLYSIACKKLLKEKIIRPGITVIERIIVRARGEGEEEIYNKLSHILTADIKNRLNESLLCDSKIKITPLTWLRRNNSRDKAKEIIENIKKLEYLKNLGAHKWDISFLSSLRLKALSSQAFDYNSQTIKKLKPYRKYPVLLSFFYESYNIIFKRLLDSYKIFIVNELKESKILTSDLIVPDTINENLKYLQNIDFKEIAAEKENKN